MHSATPSSKPQPTALSHRSLGQTFNLSLLVVPFKKPQTLTTCIYQYREQGLRYIHTMTTPLGKKRTRAESGSHDNCDTDTGHLHTGESSAKRVQVSKDPSSSKPTHIVVHRVLCAQNQSYHELHDAVADFLDEPRMLAKEHRRTMLHGQQRVVDINDLVEDRGGIQFVALITYDCTSYHDRIKGSFERLPMPDMDQAIAAQARPFFRVLHHDGPPAKALKEGLILYKDLHDALTILRTGQSSLPVSREWTRPEYLEYPYLQLYHQRQMQNALGYQYLDPLQRESIESLHNYLDQCVGSEYAEAETLFQSGMVDRKHWTKLFRPNAVMATTEAGQPIAYSCGSYPVEVNGTLQLECWNWLFDGKFHKNTTEFHIQWPSRQDDCVAIEDLQIFPLQYASNEFEKELRARGEVFWNCRFQKFVCYDTPHNGPENQVGCHRAHSNIKPVLTSVSLDEITIHGGHRNVQDDARRRGAGGV